MTAPSENLHEDIDSNHPQCPSVFPPNQALLCITLIVYFFYVCTGCHLLTNLKDFKTNISIWTEG